MTARDLSANTRRQRAATAVLASMQTGSSSTSCHARRHHFQSTRWSWYSDHDHIPRSRAFLVARVRVCLGTTKQSQGTVAVQILLRQHANYIVICIAKTLGAYALTIYLHCRHNTTSCVFVCTYRYASGDDMHGWIIQCTLRRRRQRHRAGSPTLARQPCARASAMLHLAKSSTRSPRLSILAPTATRINAFADLLTV